MASQVSGAVKGLFVAVAEGAHAVPVGLVEHALDGIKAYEDHEREHCVNVKNPQMIES